MAEEFARCFTSVYTRREQISTDLIAEFLVDIPPHRLSGLARERLEAPITLEELTSALGALEPGRAPGPNGFPIDFLRSSMPLLGPHILALIEDALDRATLPRDWHHAEIVLFLKPGRPPEDPSSYRPVSLINFEPKLLGKFLADRPRGFITELIHPDQSGFMPERATQHNIRRVHNAIATAPILGRHAALLLADIDKAFDSLSWVYLFQVLEAINLGPRFMAYIQLLYTDLTASVCIAGHLSSPFSIQRGTRQGCPLSHLLFALAIEPLAAWVGRDPVLRGFDWSRSRFDRIALYADDVLFFMTDPWLSGPRILWMLRVFGKTTGLHANPAKSILFPMYGYQGSETWAAQLSPATEGFKYFGIYISPCPKTSWSHNITPLLISLKNETTIWSALPLSLYGWSAIFKMVSLPRLLYRLQNFPYPIPGRGLIKLTLYKITSSGVVARSG